MTTETHILIIDDDPIVLAALSYELTKAGYQTTVAENGEEALALLERYPARFSAIILDRMMEKTSGLDVLHHIYRQPDLKNIPVIMLTSHAERDHVGAAMKAGAFDFLYKPIDRELLLLVIKRALAGK